MPVPSPDAIRRAVLERRDFVQKLFDDLAACGPSDSGIMRDTYGEGENRAHALLAETGKALRLAVRTDVAANTYATWAGADRTLPRVLMGSHLDSVPHGGNFDGAAGVVAGLVVVEALRALGFSPRRDIEVMGIRAEESIWFQVSYIGSRAALGSLPATALQAPRIDTGRPLRMHMADCGADTAAVASGTHELSAATLDCFLEVHIEQAPALVESKLPVAVCTGIPGNFRYPQARINGRHDHVGTPLRFRRDAAMAGAEIAMAVDMAWRKREAAGIPMAATFGRFHTDASMHGLTIVPGAFSFSLDVRAYDEAILAAFEAEFLAMVRDVGARRHVEINLGPRAEAPVGHVASSIRAALHGHAKQLNVPVMDLGSPASHDAAAFCAAGVPTAMLFVRNENGSHNPLEHMEIADFLDACSILTSLVAERAA